MNISIAIGECFCLTSALPRRIVPIVLLVVGLSGCSAYVGTKQIEADTSQPTKHGYIALYLTGRYEPEHLAPDGHTKVGVLLQRKGRIEPGINALQKSEAELKIYRAKVGSYRPPRFVMNLDVSLYHDLNLSGFDVTAGEVTYIGDYSFLFYVNKGIFGSVPIGFSVDVANNISQRDNQIRERVAAVSGEATESIVIRAPNILVGRR